MWQHAPTKMPSHLHDALVELIREGPSFAVHLLRSVLGLDEVGSAVLQKTSETATEIHPAELRTDAVFEIRNANGELAFAVIFEVQFNWDPNKLFSWPAYLGGLRLRLRCPVILVVVTPRATTARRYAEPIDLDGVGGFTLKPLVIGPADVPVVVEQERADAMPELAVLSVIAHPDVTQAADIGRCALAASAQLDDNRARFYADMVFAYIGEAARKLLEADMGLKNYEFQSDFAKRFVAAGRSEGLAEMGRRMLFRVLRARDIKLNDIARERIETCHDPEQLETWAEAAETATSIDQVFKG